MTECADRVNEYLEVTDQTLFGLSSPFDIVDGGKAAVVQALCNVTSNVKEFPADSAPYGGYLMGRLVGRAELSTTAVQQILVFVEMDKADHVKFFKQGLETAKKELSGGDSAKETTKTLRPAEERAIIERTGATVLGKAVRRKVTGVRGGSDSLNNKGAVDEALQKEAALRKGTEESLRKAFNKIDTLESLVRKLEKPGSAIDSRPSDSNRCYKCGEVGHFGRDCPVRKAKDK